jgi:hypothetical protein
VRRRLGAALAGTGAAALAAPAAASAHGISVRADLPIPEWLFGWAAAMVLLVSFVALAALWPAPRLQEDGWRPLPGLLGRIARNDTVERTLGAAAMYSVAMFALEIVTEGDPGLGVWLLIPVAVAVALWTPRPIEVVAGAAGVFLLGLVVYSGLEGVQTTAANFAPTFVYVVFWVGLVPVSLLFGDVFRAFNPWRAIGRLVGWIATTAARGEVPAPLSYPAWLGRIPAVAGLFAFTAMELVISDGDKPESVAIAALVYSALTFVAMALFGVERWIRDGETFSVYFNLYARMSPLEVRDGVAGVRRPLSGLPSLPQVPGTVALLAVIIGSTSFDGASEAPLWTGIAPDIANFFESVGFKPETALELAFGVGLTAGVLIVYGFFRLGIAGATGVGGGFTNRRLANAFVHTLVPIAFAYVAAHYMTLLLFQGQATWFLISDPLGDGADIFGTADRQIDYTVIGSTATWYFQVGFVVVGHVLALTLAHDRALALYDRAKLAVRSQYWMLIVMVGFTSLALWLLSQSNT